MTDYRIIKLDSRSLCSYDLKYNIKLRLKNQQEILNFYKKFEFELDQLDRTKVDSLNNIIFPNHSSKSGFTAIPVSNHTDETVIVLKRQISDNFDSKFEDSFFEKIKGINDEIKNVHNKYDFPITCCAILCIILYGIPPYIILKKKKNSQLQTLENKYQEVLEGLKDYKVDTLDTKELNTSEISLNDHKVDAEMGGELIQLKKLREQELISEEEYEKKRKQILGI